MFDVFPANGQTWLICGGRDFADRTMFRSAMADLMRLKGCPVHIVSGGASGADALAEEWAESMAARLSVYQANWRDFGKAAGPMRNQQMLEKGRPDLVIAFPGGRGTADMVMKARAAGIDVAEILVTAEA